jgi:glycine betaine/proline transport system substrate-binding protein
VSRLQVEHVYKVFGRKPGKAVTRLQDGADRDELRDGGTTAAVIDASFEVEEKEPVVVTLWSPHWAYAKYGLRKLKDPRGAWGRGDAIHTVAAKAFPSGNPVVARWLKNFRMNEKQLTGLEERIQQAGKGQEQQAVRDWLKQNPGLVDTWAPVPKHA